MVPESEHVTLDEYPSENGSRWVSPTGAEKLKSSKTKEESIISHKVQKRCFFPKKRESIADLK